MLARLSSILGTSDPPPSLANLINAARAAQSRPSPDVVDSADSLEEQVASISADLAAAISQVQASYLDEDREAEDHNKGHRSRSRSVEGAVR